jgi:hypothetical protein
MSDYIKAIDANNEPHVEVDDPPINICPKCGADLFDVGVKEVIVGGYSETGICFADSKAEIGITSIQDFDEQWALCGKCNEQIEYTAGDVIEAFEHLHPPETRSD